ncbi:MAG: VCBS repeat-containing protein [Actinomyces sp.]|nr:MAG: VCBS repeat-containing protein [Actinomyces sp.]
MRSASPSRTAVWLAAALAAALAASGVAVVTAPGVDAGSVTWPKAWSVELGGTWNRSSSPAIADLDGDGGGDVVFGAQDGRIRAWRGDGTALWTTSAVPGISAGCRGQSTPTAVDSSPAVGDVDGDGRVEVVVGLGSNWVPDQNGSVLVLDGRTGAVEWRWTGNRDFGDVWHGSVIDPVTHHPVGDGWCEPVYSTPALGDVDGDGRLDIVFGGWDQRIHALDGTGRELAGFPVAADDTVWSSPALFDADGDGAVDIFIGTDSSPGGIVDHRGGVLRALSWKNGTVVDLWRQYPNEVVMSSPVIGDIDGDHRPEVVVGTGEYWHVTCGPSCGTDHVRVFAWHVDDGSPVPGWPVSTGGTVITSPALGDVDGDGLDEVIVGSYDGQVYAFDGTGALRWRTRPTFSHLGSGRVTGHPVVADLDGDGDQDVAVGTDRGVALLEGRTGSQLDDAVAWQQRPGFALSYETAPAVGVLAGARRLVTVGFQTSPVRTNLAVHTLPATPAGDDWPQFGHDARRTGDRSTDWCGVVGPSGRFCDVQPGSYYERGVGWMTAGGITTGVAPRLYAPYRTLTRAQMITFLWREVGAPSGYPSPGFVDVAAGRYYTAAVAWAAATGVTTGVGGGRFAPDDPVTRAQAAAFLYRAAGLG